MWPLSRRRAGRIRPRGVAFRITVPVLSAAGCQKSWRPPFVPGVIAMPMRVWSVVALLALITSPALAQDRKGSGPRIPSKITPAKQPPMETKRDIKVTGADTAAPKTGPLSEDQLQAMLQAMGYEVKADGMPGGRWFTVGEGRWNIQLSFSSDNSTLWVMQFLNKIADPAKAPSGKVLTLMPNNGTWGYFAYFSQSQFLVIERDVPNNGITPAQLRKVISNIAALMTETQSLWYAENALAP